MEPAERTDRSLPALSAIGVVPLSPALADPQLEVVPLEALAVNVEGGLIDRVGSADVEDLLVRRHNVSIA